MMTWVVMAFLIVGGAIAQMLLPAPSWLGHAKPPVLLGVVLYYALNREMGVTVVAALAAGFLQDVLSPLPMGCSVVCLLLSAAVAGRFKELVMNEAAITAAIFGFALALVMTLAVYVVLRQGGRVASPVWIGLWKSVGAGGLAIVSTPLVFALAGGFDRLVGNVERRKSVAA